MWLLVATGQDTSARWAFERMRARGRRCQVLLTEALQSAGVKWVHHVSSDRASVTVTLADGRRIETGEVTAVLNRMVAPPLSPLARGRWPDSGYARAEESAFALSWLPALAPAVLNAPAARGLAGAWRSPVEWSALARRAGLSFAPLARDSHEPGDLWRFPLTPQNGLVIGEETFGLADRPELRAGVVRLAREAQTPLLGLWFTPEVTPRLAMATPHPDLSLGGEPGVDALEELLSA